jgi:DNA-binding response OmpR family regulator
MTKVLLVEDDHNLGIILKEYLEAKGYHATLCRDGEAGWNTYQTGEFEFCIFDVMLPKLDGFSLGEKVREVNAHIPIIFLTAKSLKEDTIHGLKIGADDYITKPFRMEELLLRMQAILRRTLPTPAETNQASLSIGKYIFWTDSQRLVIGEQEQKLTSKESDLLKMLIQHKNQVLDRTLALKQIWGDDSYYNARSMDVYITKLRRHLSQDEKLQIINVHGQGFKLVELTQ